MTDKEKLIAYGKEVYAFIEAHQRMFAMVDDNAPRVYYERFRRVANLTLKVINMEKQIDDDKEKIKFRECHPTF